MSLKLPITFIAAASTAVATVLMYVGPWERQHAKESPPTESAVKNFLKQLIEAPPAAGPLTPVETPAEPPPPVVTAQDWRTLSEPSAQEQTDLLSVVAGHPDAQLELSVLLDFARFRNQLALWKTGRGGQTDAQRHELMQHLLDQLPAHYARGDLLGAEALALAQQLIEDLEPDIKRQVQQVDEFKAQLLRAVDPANQQDPASTMTAFSAYHQRQTQIVLDFESLPAEQRNAEHLQTDFETERHLWLTPPRDKRP